MDTFDWENYAQNGRFISQRQVKQRQKSDADKSLIQLNRKLRNLRKQINSLGYEELNPPIQRGWKRFFVLTQNVEQSFDSRFFQILLEKINTTQYSNRRDFKVKRRRRGKKVYVLRPQTLNELNEYAFAKLTEKEKLYFRLEWELCKNLKLFKKFVFNEPLRFVLQVKPNMITKVKIIDPLLLQGKSIIYNYLDNRYLTPKMCRLTEGYYQYKNRWNPKDKAKYKFILKPISIEIEE
jgi:hypothetical protein